MTINVEGNPIDISVCRLPLERGNCGAYSQRWGFDSVSGKCIQFVYSGCGGSANNFETKEACEQKCVGKNFYPLTSFPFFFLNQNKLI